MAESTDQNIPNPVPLISANAVATTPMLIQYLEIKSRYPDAILFYRMGDFYEMFFEDARTAAPILEVQLTSRDRNSANPIPMCGIPHHAATAYLQRLLAAGYKVALCEQIEDPATAKGIVRRDVVRVMTPALIGDPELVAENTRNFLLSVRKFNSGGADFDVCLLDLLGSQVRVGTAGGEEALLEIFAEYQPKEILIPTAEATSEESEAKEWLGEITAHFPTTLVTARPYFGENLPSTNDAKSKSKSNPDLGTSVAYQALKRYLSETQKLDSIPSLGEPVALYAKKNMSLDSTTLASLEVVRPAHEGGRSLAEVVDFTLTPMGRRRLREWLCHPSLDFSEIEARLDAVQALAFDLPLNEKIKTALSPVRDLERLNSKTALGLAMPRDIVSIREVLQRIPGIREILSGSDSALLKRYAKELDPLPQLCGLLEEALEDAPAATLRDGGIFRDGYRPEIAQYRALSKDAKGVLASIETREKTRTGIPTLKLKYSKVFGYTIEITKSYLDRVPADYVRKQTIAGGERYITEELKNFEGQVIAAEHKLRALEEGLFLELRHTVGQSAACLAEDARLLAELDVLFSFARAARERGYRRPKFNSEGRLRICEGRHPVIETMMAPGGFVPNSIELTEDGCRTLILTGPNMGGKSTIMRQVALVAMLAQAGSFVPAESADLPILDAVFTRIGSSDDLARGRSTFMVEMTEVARILKRATAQSLIVIDEIGRGTSTYDGLSLAWSLLEHIHLEVRAKTLFATHFHEVTALEKSLPGLRNANVLVQKWKEEVVFHYKLGDGPASQSYGIEVAKLAGLPKTVLGRAKEILGLLETQSQRSNKNRSRILQSHSNQLVFFDDPPPPESRAGLDA